MQQVVFKMFLVGWAIGSECEYKEMTGLETEYNKMKMKNKIIYAKNQIHFQISVDKPA
ncbi:MAG: hypothetical protein K5897_07200 [Eubacterium sp.]|nr:hypothetical protein [Eubacterium sp.]